MSIAIRELKPSELPLLAPLIRQLNPKMSQKEFTRRLNERPDNYRAVGAFEGKKLVGCCGFWIAMRFWCGKQFYLDSYVVDANQQGKGIGKKIADWLEAQAKKEKCDLITLDSYITSSAAHAFYYSQGYAISGYHLTKMPGSTEPGKLPLLK